MGAIRGAKPRDTPEAPFPSTRPASPSPTPLSLSSRVSLPFVNPCRFHVLNGIVRWSELVASGGASNSLTSTTSRGPAVKPLATRNSHLHHLASNPAPKRFSSWRKHDFHNSRGSNSSSLRLSSLPIPSLLQSPRPHLTLHPLPSTGL